MLVLSRKIGESIIVGNNIEIVVIRIDGNTVKLGINAPRTIKVYRKEIYDQLLEENRKAIEFDLKDISEVTKFDNKR
ncbi:carbon storage regulator CsrA [Thermosipho ferrireducens]|uniref:Translational regulator CsrA n=1 Tax=Thermosipho ferrireducens TaxID=2571116 RepID=A0ABX7S5X9_9BACT|nr:carbon storage regulator CsrA [Thermosipho ferrireducens]QTA37120.1 carbon storage regulator CsrA [Thermosipho ferrireducens]